MRYRSTVTQLVIVYLFDLFYYVIPNVLSADALTHTAAVRGHPSYAGTWKVSMNHAISALFGIIIGNTIGVRAVFALTAVAKIAYQVSLITLFNSQTYKFFVASNIMIDSMSYVISSSTFMILLAYPREKSKAKMLSLFMFPNIINLVIYFLIRVNLHSSRPAKIITLYIALGSACLSLPISLALAPPSTVTRDDGEYVAARKTTFLEELVSMWPTLFSKWSLLLVPFMFTQYYILSVGTVIYVTDTKTSVCLMTGLVLAFILACTLDMKLKSRRYKGFYGFILVSASLVGTISMAIVLQIRYHGMFPISAVSKEPALVYAMLIFTGLSLLLSSIFTLWVIGTLTNDTRATARLSGLTFCMTSVGGLVGSLVVRHSGFLIPKPLVIYVGAGLVGFSLVCLCIVVANLPNANNWLLPRLRQSLQMSRITKEILV